jgi:hypothetical protein
MLTASIPLPILTPFDYIFFNGRRSEKLRPAQPMIACRSVGPLMMRASLSA